MRVGAVAAPARHRQMRKSQSPLPIKTSARDETSQGMEGDKQNHDWRDFHVTEFSVFEVRRGVEHGAKRPTWREKRRPRLKRRGAGTRDSDARGRDQWR